LAANFRSRLTFSNVVALLALFVALGGGAYAAMKVKPNSVGTKQLKDNAVTGDKVKDGSLKSGDFGAGQLPEGQKGDKGEQGPPGPVALVTVRGAETAVANNTEAGATAACPAGMSATGGGASLDGTIGADVNGSYPTDGPDADVLPDDAWLINANNTTGSSKNVRAYVICAQATSTSYLTP
jgi:hypothetical protein